MVSERLYKEEDHHDAVSGRKKAHNGGTDYHKNLRDDGHFYIAEEADSRHNDHTEHTGTFTRNLEKASLNGINVEDFIKIVGLDVAAQPVRQRNADQRSGKETGGLFSGCFIHDVISFTVSIRQCGRDETYFFQYITGACRLATECII